MGVAFFFEGCMTEQPPSDLALQVPGLASGKVPWLSRAKSPKGLQLADFPGGLGAHQGLKLEGCMAGKPPVYSQTSPSEGLQRVWAGEVGATDPRLETHTRNTIWDRV